ncbi:MAG: branched-chain amino acid transport system permease protein [Frankiaceae bacterium]|jgi:branched-chain amino acid transport system permease protein|nr:branched-chain amino acid transport system permease protein [Frankiaceae bacterium]
MHDALLAGSQFSGQINFLSPLINGIANGAAYGLLGLGLVLLYKSNRIFNFAQGEFATVGAIVTYVFYAGTGVLPKLPFFLAAVLGLLGSVGIALLTERLVIRPMFNRAKVILVVGTVGVALLLIGVEGLLPYPKTQSLPTISDVLKVQPFIGRIDNVPVLDQDIAKLAMLVVLAVGAFVFFRYTHTGTAILAVSQDATAARVVGISVERISLISWGIAGLLGGVAGILLAVPPTGSVTPGAFTGTTLTVSFAAAVLGGMTSLPGAFVGGLSLGLIEAFASADAEFVPGLNHVHSGQAELAVFLVLLLVLLVRPRGLLGQEA